MKKEDRIKELLLLHCKGCSGTLWGCNGCDKEQKITEIMNKK